LSEISKNDSSIVFDMPKCGGCRTCEMACSFHHTKEFRPSVSSLQILDKEDSRGYHVRFVTRSVEQRIACDGCKDLETPLCVEYCKEQDDLIAMIKKATQETI